MEGTKELVVILITSAGGIFCVLACIFNWDFFFENRKAKFFVSIFGRQGARIFYSLLGFVLFFLAFKIVTQ